MKTLHIYVGGPRDAEVVEFEPDGDEVLTEQTAFGWKHAVYRPDMPAQFIETPQGPALALRYVDGT